MNAVFNVIPFVAVVLGQTVSTTNPSLALWGPMSIICGWMIWRDERRAVQHDRLRDGIGDIVHQLKGLNRNLLYQAATFGPPGIKDVAQKELERIMGKT